MHVPIGADFDLPNFDLDSAVRIVSDCIGDPFEEEVPEGVQRALRDKGVVGKLPRQAVEDYLYYLCDHYLLQGDGGGGFEIAKDRAKRLEYEHKQWQLRERRRQFVEDVVDKILGSVPLDEQHGFSRTLWQKRRIAGLDYTLDAFLQAEEADWQRLKSALRAIEQMIEGGEPVTAMLGLPLKGAVQRAQERERQRLRREADEREYKLRDAAFRVLGYAASDWLCTPPDADAPVILARNSQAGLDAAFDALTTEESRRRTQAAADALAVDCRRQLKAEAEKGLGTEKAKFFLHNYDANLKARPWDVAINKGGLLSARGELKTWIEREKRSRR